MSLSYAQLQRRKSRALKRYNAIYDAHRDASKRAAELDAERAQAWRDFVEADAVLGEFKKLAKRGRSGRAPTTEAQ